MRPVCVAFTREVGRGGVWRREAGLRSGIIRFRNIKLQRVLMRFIFISYIMQRDQY